MKRTLLVALISVALASAAGAEELEQIFTKVNELVAGKNYTKALEELEWARKEIEKKHSARLQELLPNQVGDFVGEKGNSNSALGFSTIEKKYKNPTTQVQIALSLVGSSSADGGGLGGLAQLGKMAAMFGGNEGGVERDSIRIEGRTATVETNPAKKSAEMTIFLDSGSMLKLEMTKSAEVGTLRSFAQMLKLGELDSYLRGTTR